MKDLAPILARVNRKFCWVKTENGPRRIDDPLDDARIESHLSGKRAFGACPMEPGSSTTRLALYDLDSHKGETLWMDMLAAASSIQGTLQARGMKPRMFRSSGGAGIHIFLLWKQPQDAYSVREMLRDVLSDVLMTPGTGGVIKNEVEIFPKQDSIPADGFGSMFVLPFAGKSAPIDDEAWGASADVEVKTKPPRTAVQLDTPDLVKLKSALEHIPNEPDTALSYDDWRNYIFAIHHATNGSDEGLELAHQFSARSGKHNEDFLDNRVWPYARSDRGNAITAATVFHAAREAGWSEPVDHLFENLGPVDSAAATGTGRRFEFVQSAQFAARRAPDWIVYSTIPRAGLAVLFGESGSGKSFLALDIGIAVACGRDWRGLQVNQSSVAYIVAEGIGGFSKRLSAYAQQHAVDLADVPLHILGDTPNFMKGDDMSAVIEGVKAIPTTPGLIIVDTWAQVTPGANENAGEDMGKALAQCKRLHAATGALVLLVHHSGKDASKGARGWSGLNAASDCTIEVLRSDNDRVATITKMKDGEDGAEFGFKLLTVQLSEDVSSCVIEHTVAVEKSKRKKEPSGAVQKRVLTAIPNHIDVDGWAELLDVINEAIELEYLDPGVAPGSSKDRRRDKVNKAIHSLNDAKWVTIEGPKVRLA